MAKKKRPFKKSSKFVHEDPWRVFRIMSEFVEGFDEMSHIGPAVTIFGSARTKPRDRYYKATVDLSRRLAENNFAVITGGGPGIMEAANRGAYDVGAKSIGLNIHLPHEQFPNPYIAPELCFQFHYFGIRKLHFFQRAHALVAYPGGFGTMDELFEILTLMQTRKTPLMPVVLVGRQYWEHLIDFEIFVGEGMIAPEDLEIFTIVETAEEAWEHIKQWHIERKTPLYQLYRNAKVSKKKKKSR